MADLKIDLKKSFCGVAADGNIELWSNGKLFAESASPLALIKDTSMSVTMPANIFPAAATGAIQIDTKNNTCSASVPGALFAGPKSGTVPFIGAIPKK
jgi:hypothetical protein